MYHFCTYFDQNYLPRGLALYHSLARYAQPFMLYVLCMDEGAYDLLSKLDLAYLTPISLEDFERGDEALLEAKTNRSLIEYYFTCTPSLPLYILNHFPNVDLITYLDADLYFFADPAPIYDELGEQSILIVGHRFPEELRDREKYGIYNVSFLTFRNNVHGRECLDWWRERCLEWCYDRLEETRFADQKYLDDWPIRFQQVVVLKHKGAGLAPWNIAAYSIREDKGSVLVDSASLIFYHFHHLKIHHRFLFDTGLEDYRASLNTTSRQRIYAPYLQELKNMMRQTGSNFAHKVRRRDSYNGLSGLLRLVLRRKLLLTVGPVTTAINLKPVRRTLLSLKRSTLGHKSAK